jgi:crotonobetainyl-CoA:carnitine CoA-transferase CaiB-like acyl-CoA transferase
VPYEAFDTADAPLLICCGNDRLFAKLAAVLGRPDWAGDERFASNRARLANKAALVGADGAAAAGAAARHWMARFEAAGVPCAPVHTVPEALAHPQVQALGLLQPVPGEDFPLTALPLTVDGQRPGLRGRCAAPGRTQRAHGLPAPVDADHP